jgi:hypothetical protein
MADGLLSQVNAAMHTAATQAAHDLFRNPNGVNDIRWEGMSNPELANAVRLLSDGPGAAGVTQAADALTTIANNLQQIDQALTNQLQAVGVNWQSQAAELAQEMTTASAAYSGAAGAAGGANATGVTNQGDAFSAAKNAVPNVSDLQSPPGGSFLTNATQTLTSHQNDQAQQAAQANRARQQTIDAMHNYTNSSQSGLSGHTPAPPPPGYAVAPKAVDTGIGQVTTPAGFVPPPPVTVPSGSTFPGGPSGGGSAGGGSGGVPGFPGMPGGVPSGGAGSAPGVSGAMPGGPGVSGVGAPGVGVPGIGVPGGGGLPGVGLPVGGLPGAPVGGAGNPLAPGPVSGIGPTGGPAGSAAGVASAAQASATGAIVEDAAVGAAIVGGTAGAGIAGASTRPDERVRSRLAGENIDEDATGARQQAARALAELEGEEAEAAGVSERIGATAEPPPSVLEPAVGARRRDDDEHDNRYGVDTDLFDDDRMVVPSVLDGGDQTESK